MATVQPRDNQRNRSSQWPILCVIRSAGRLGLWVLPPKGTRRSPHPPGTGSALRRIENNKLPGFMWRAVGERTFVLPEVSHARLSCCRPLKTCVAACSGSWRVPAWLSTVGFRCSELCAHLSPSSDAARHSWSFNGTTDVGSLCPADSQAGRKHKKRRCAVRSLKKPDCASQARNCACAITARRMCPATFPYSRCRPREN
jgi:hypothetical protein